MFLPDWFLVPLCLGALAVLAAQYARRRRIDRRAHNALAFAGALARTIQKSIASGQEQSALEAAAQIDRLAQQGVVAGRAQR